MRRACLGFCLSVVTFVGPAAAQTPLTAVNAPQGSGGPAVAAEASATPSAPAAPKPLMPSFKSLFSSVGHDFRGMASRDNLFLLGLGSAAAASAHTFDRRVATTPWGAGPVEETLEPGQFLGSTLSQMGGAFATYALGRATGSTRLASFGAQLFRAQLVTEGTVQAVKFATQRTRPDGTSLSFPSGHTASAFATATVIKANFGWKAGIPAYIAASMIGASRIQMDRHYVSDVLAGATVGILAGRSVTLGFGGARFAVSPTAINGGIGISVVKK